MHQQHDTEHQSTDRGVMVLVVRKDTAEALATEDGNYSGLQVDEDGYLRVTMPGDGNRVKIDELAVLTEIRNLLVEIRDLQLQIA